MNLFDPELSWELLKSMLDTQQYMNINTTATSRMIPLDFNPDRPEPMEMMQPPLLSMAIYTNYMYLKDKLRLQQALPVLEAYVTWDLMNRDRNGNGLLEWRVDVESRLDQSPLFDHGYDADSVDFSTYIAQEMYYLSLICHELERVMYLLLGYISCQDPDSDQQ